MANMFTGCTTIARYPINAVIILAAILYPIVGYARVVDIGPTLPDLLKEHSDKGWLIKFYAPWCHHCKQLEPTYSTVADLIHRQYNDLIVGRVDCTKYSSTCQQFQVDSFPTINYLKDDTSISYRGDRSLNSLVNFAERMRGPDIRTANDCNQLETLVRKHDLIVLLSEPSKANEQTREVFRKLAKSMKSSHWFYQIFTSCDGLTNSGKIHIMKKHLKRAILIDGVSTSDEQPEQVIARIVKRESQPIFGTLNNMNFDRTVALNRTTIIALLDEYKPAKKFTPSSVELYSIVEQLAADYAQREHDILFTWSSDADLIRSIVVDKIAIPNIVVLRADMSNFVALDRAIAKPYEGRMEKELHPSLKKEELLKLLKAYDENKIKFYGGGYLDSVVRVIYSCFMKLTSMYEANPLLCSLLIGFPSMILVFVIYTTCYVESPNYTANYEENHNEASMDEEDLDSDSDTELVRRKKNHAKQE